LSVHLGCLLVLLVLSQLIKFREVLHSLQQQASGFDLAMSLTHLNLQMQPRIVTPASSSTEPELGSMMSCPTGVQDGVPSGSEESFGHLVYNHSTHLLV
jgi:hypothetical protein